MVHTEEILFGELARQVIASKEPPARSKATYRSARLHIGYLIEHFGNKPFKEITDLAWDAYVAKCKKEKPNRRLWHDRVHFKQINIAAIDAGHMTRKLKLRIPDRSRSIGRELTPAEIKALLEHAGPRLRLQIEIAYKMGLRKGEMMALRWDQFDWCSRQIILTDNDTKTRRGRMVPINPDVLTRLQMKHAMSGSPYVFPSKLDPNVPMAHNHTAWRVCKRKAGVTRARWHDWRVTCASLMARRGVPENVNAKLLGHSAKVNREIYAKVNEQDMWDATKKMAERA